MVFLDGALVSRAGPSSLAGNRGMMAYFARTPLIICSDHAPENVIALFSWYALCSSPGKMPDFIRSTLPSCSCYPSNIPSFPRQIVSKEMCWNCRISRLKYHPRTYKKPQGSEMKYSRSLHVPMMVEPSNYVLHTTISYEVFEITAKSSGE